jgi:hypothetical protein
MMMVAVGRVPVRADPIRAAAAAAAAAGWIWRDFARTSINSGMVWIACDETCATPVTASASASRNEDASGLATMISS